MPKPEPEPFGPNSELQFGFAAYLFGPDLLTIF
jgi:hypothetical protein